MARSKDPISPTDDSPAPAKPATEDLYAVFGANDVLPCGLIYLDAGDVPAFGLAFDQERASAGLASAFMRPATDDDLAINRGQAITDRRAAALGPWPATPV